MGDAGGCVKKKDGTWCPKGDGAWVRKEDGKVWSKGDAGGCVKKKDGTWCPKGDGAWVRKEDGKVWSKGAADSKKDALMNEATPGYITGDVEAPKGVKDMGGWQMRRYNEEQQARLHIDEQGRPQGSHPKDCYFDKACHALVDWTQITKVKKWFLKQGLQSGVKPLLAKAHDKFLAAGMPDDRIDYILKKWAKYVKSQSRVAKDDTSRESNKPIKRLSSSPKASSPTPHPRKDTPIDLVQTPTPRSSIWKHMVACIHSRRWMGGALLLGAAFLFVMLAAVLIWKKRQQRREALDDTYALISATPGQQQMTATSYFGSESQV